MGWGARFTGVVFVGSLLSVLVACGSSAGPEPQVLATAFEEPPPAASGEPDAAAALSADFRPTEPPDAAEADLRGIQTFALFWVATANYALSSGDVEQLDRISTKSCKTCKARIDDITTAFRNGGRIEGGFLKVLDSSATELRGRTPPSIDLDVTVSAERVLAPDGTLVNEYPPDQLRLTLILERVGQRWKVDHIRLDEQS